MPSTAAINLRDIETEVREQNALQKERDATVVSNAQAQIIDPIIKQIKDDWDLNLKITEASGKYHYEGETEATFKVHAPKSTLKIEVRRKFGYGGNFSVQIETPLSGSDRAYISGGGPAHDNNRGTAQEVVRRALRDIVSAKVSGTLKL